MAMLLFGTLPAADPELAGEHELDAIAAKVAELAVLIDAKRAQLDTNHQETLEMLADEADRRARGWHAYSGTLPSTLEDFGASYIMMLRECGGFDALAPSSDFQHRWQAVRQQEHRLNDEFVGLMAAYHHLERLRDRLRQQLGLTFVH